MRILRLIPPPPPLKILFFSLLALTASCNLHPKDKNNSVTPSLDANTQAFIQNFQKQDLYTTTASPAEKDKVVINPNTADITIPTTATASAFGSGKLIFVRALSSTKAVYRKEDNNYILLEYDSTGGTDQKTMIQSSSPSATDNFTDTTSTSNGNGALYKK